MIECLRRMLWDEREALSWVKLVICMFGYFLMCLIQNVYEMCHFREATLLMGICKFDTFELLSVPLSPHFILQ